MDKVLTICADEEGREKPCSGPGHLNRVKYGTPSEQQHCKDGAYTAGLVGKVPCLTHGK